MSARDDLRRYANLMGDIWTSPKVTDERVEQLYAAVRAEVLAEAKTEVIAWLVKKAREGTPVEDLASKVDRGAIRLFFDSEHRAEKASAPAPTATPAALTADDITTLTTLAPARNAVASGDATSVHLDLVATREEWTAWQTALAVDLSRTTSRGSSVTSHGTWRGIHIAIRCYVIAPSYPVVDGRCPAPKCRRPLEDCVCGVRP